MDHEILVTVTYIYFEVKCCVIGDSDLHLFLGRTSDPTDP